MFASRLPHHRRLVVLLALALTIATVLSGRSASAQEQRCFGETAQCISGRFLEYWEQNGGLAVFGLPITAAQNEVNPDTGQTYLTQWFERNRFELHGENQRPYDVLLGRLGDARLVQQGRTWHSFPKGDPAAPHFFEATGHAVAEIFWGYWSGHGLEFDGQQGTSFQESLALFGMPLSEPMTETNASGDTVLTQWFERARFEHHPDKPAPHTVLLGLLGREVTTPPPPPPPPPAPACSDVPPSERAEVPSPCVRPGEQFRVVAVGFNAEEPVGFYLVNPKGVAQPFAVIKGDGLASTRGRYHVEGAVSLQSEPGIYILVFMGQKSGKTAGAHFRVLPPDPAVPNPTDHSLIPPGQGMTVDPIEASRGTAFFFRAGGFKPHESIQIHAILPDGSRIDAPFNMTADERGVANEHLRFNTEIGDLVGIYENVYEGLESGHVARAFFRLQP